MNINDKKVWDNCRDILPFPYSVEDAKQFLKSVIENNIINHYCISIQGEAVGNISLSPDNDVERFSAEIGYWISQKYQNQNIMSRALTDVIEHYFNSTHFVRIYANVFGFNQSSHRVLHKAGFSGVGVKHKAVFKNGRFTDMYEYEILRESGYICFERTDAESRDFKELVSDLEKELNATNAVYSQGIYSKFNITKGIDTVVVAYFDETPAGCGCFRKYDDGTMEIKRMFVRPQYRRKGISNIILNELERWGKEHNDERAILETGRQHIQAMNLYKKNGYFLIENYDEYKNIENSLCLCKELN